MKSATLQADHSTSTNKASTSGSKAGKKLKIAYWITTALFVLPMIGSSIAYLTKAPDLVQNMSALGYPLYMLVILGVAKALGVLGILQPRYDRLKEWAYAGFTFNLLGAAASHGLNGDAFGKVLAPLVLLGIMLASYVLWHKRRDALN